MQFFILVLFICLFVFLYCVYLLGQDDFIFLRKDVTMEKVFNIIFAGSLSCLLFSRIFYGLAHGGNIFTNPLVFFLFPYFFGLNLLGAVVGGGAVFLYLLTRKKNNLPLGRLSDFFSVAFLITLPIGFLGYLIFKEEGFSVVEISVVTITYLLLSIIFLKFLLPQMLNGKLKEGTITLIFLICFSIISLASNAYPKISTMEFFQNFENLILIIGLIASIVFLIRVRR